MYHEGLVRSRQPRQATPPSSDEDSNHGGDSSSSSGGSSGCSSPASRLHFDEVLLRYAREARLSPEYFVGNMAPMVRGAVASLRNPSASRKFLHCPFLPATVMRSTGGATMGMCAVSTVLYPLCLCAACDACCGLYGTIVWCLYTRCVFVNFRFHVRGVALWHQGTCCASAWRLAGMRNITRGQPAHNCSVQQFTVLPRVCVHAFNFL